MIRAGGVIISSLETKRICLLMRNKDVSHPLEWSFPGGKIGRNEKILQGISRELREELGFVPKHKKVIPIDVFKSLDGNFQYYSFVVIVKEEFIPKLNSENLSWGWFDISALPKPLHSGARVILKNPNFNKIYNQIVADES